MTYQPESGHDAAGPLPPITPLPVTRELHSLQDLPLSLGQVSNGPLGSVSRKDHLSWKTKGIGEPAYWFGRIDSALGERIHPRPIPAVAVCFAMGLFLAMFTNCAGNRG